MIDDLLRFLDARPGRRVFPGIQIPVKAGEVAAGDLQTDAVTGQKHVARRPHVDVVLVHLPWFKQRSRLIFFLPVPRPENPMLDVRTRPVNPCRGFSVLGVIFSAVLRKYDPCLISG